MESPTADEALVLLKKGNERFRTGRDVGTVQSGSRREDLIKSQRPFAIMLSCSDSRVPLEIIFNTGLGDLFVIRVAGNVANQSSIASVEFAVKYLETKLIVVMAHQNCGAISAAIEGGDRGKNLNHLVSHIQPALAPPETDVDVVARHNARNSAERLVKDSDIIRKAIEEDGVKIVTAFFHFSNGEVAFD